MSARKTYEEFVKDYLDKWGEMKYEFDESTYVDMHTPMRFICPEHGEFWRIPKNMMYYECRKCSYIKRGYNSKLTTDEFINKANIVHNWKYDYSESIYTGTKNEIKIICPKHGEFWQKPNYHLSGRGCPKCNESHLEREVKKILNEIGIEFIYQYRTDWLEKQSLDFFIPNHNIGIECQGKQHFGFGGWSNDFNFNNLYILDEKKYNLCINNDIKMIYVINNSDINKVNNNICYKNNIILLKNLKKCITEIL